MVSGLGWLSPVRSFRNFFGRYGTVSGSMRGLFNGIVPVAVVDRFRDDTEGSLFGMQMFCNATAARFPAFAMGSPQDDWELLALNTGILGPVGAGNEAPNFMVYTPDATYQPIQALNPLGVFTPGLNLDWSFTLSTVTGVAGSNATLPGRNGFFPETGHRLPVAFVGVNHLTGAYTFDPPLRVYRDVTLGILGDLARVGTTTYMASVLWRVLPRTTDGPRTG